MTSEKKTGLASAALGLISGDVIALIVMWLIPEIGHPISVQHLSEAFWWALFFSSPFGFLVGAALGSFLHQRAPTVTTFRRLVLEAVALTMALSAVATQVVLPAAWNLPRGRITALIVACAGGAAAAETWLLKRLYWASDAREDQV